MRTDMLLVFPHLFFKLMCLIKASNISDFPVGHSMCFFVIVFKLK